MGGLDPTIVYVDKLREDLCFQWAPQKEKNYKTFSFMFDALQCPGGISRAVVVVVVVVQ